MTENNENRSDIEVNHARALELRKSLSTKFDEEGFGRIDKIVHEAATGTAEQVVEEVLAKIKKLGIVGAECQPVTEEITEYAALMKKLELARN